MSDNRDPFKRVDYRRLIAWPQRIQREAPFLQATLDLAPEKSVLDLGCGTGEHSRFFFELGYTTVGLDKSPSMLEKAEEFADQETLRFVLGDIQDLRSLVSGKFGAVVSLGNTLVHLREKKELELGLIGISQTLLAGGVFLFQILNYTRIIEKNIRYLPLNFVERDGKQTIFLRVMDHSGDGNVTFCPTTLVYDPEQETPIQVEQSRRVLLKGWTYDELEPILEKTGFTDVRFFGDMQGGEFDEIESNDLIVMARVFEP